MAQDPLTSSSQPSSEFLKTVPHLPGVYLMRSGEDMVLYVGKARDLRNRLASYRSGSAGKFAKTEVMLKQVERIETILTATEKEALILEASLIKKYRPRYNVILRDDKSYPYVKVTVTEKWPRLVISRRRRQDGDRWFGPFSSSSALKETLKLVRQLYPLRLCRGRELRPRTRPCLNYQMGRCQAPCSNLADRAGYLEAVDQVIRILEGRRGEVVVDLKRRMAEASAALEFEQAAFFRDRLQSLQATLEKQVVAAGHHRDQDVIALVRHDLAASLSIIKVRDGAVSGHQTYFLADPVGDDEEVIGQVLARYYGEDRLIPSEILLSHQPENSELLEEWLGEQKGSRVRLRVPQRGTGLQLVAMARENARQVFAEEDKKIQASQVLIRSLAKALQLDRMPQRIECLDISNIGGKLAVGSLVLFQNGEPVKSGYRHYRIRELTTPDDYGMMYEVLTRRFAATRRQEGDPDLLLLDGGKGQLNIAIQVLAELGVEGRVDLAGIAKEKKEEGEKIYRPGRKNPILFPRHSPVLLYLMRIRDEAHRFGVTFHRKLRKNDTLKSSLDTIPGIGPARRQLLLKQFGSIKGVAKATEKELVAIPGISKVLALLIRQAMK
ncbi:MAG: excinuclease ABC subunit UvrC [Proteobacteria bacterium]|nr:excinuclease ABC subunit UvrC [Pseudomonadota bacterium]MBU1686604.1 excinuclease ABC subunit UvrC [Pseudomonadota bacterium]